MSINGITQNQRQDSPHPYHIPYSPICICVGCQGKPYWDGKIHYSLCLSCLQRKELGPFKARYHKDDHYYSLFWTTDYERKDFNKKGTMQ